MHFGTRLAPVHGARACVFAPSFSAHVGGVEDHAGDVDEAGVVEPCRTAWCSCPHTPARDQIMNRRCAVVFDMPKHGGRARQAQSLTST
jgi:hypothetical protein